MKWIDIGFLWEDDRHVVFFGGVGSSLENLRVRFPKYHWARIKQTHSDHVVSAELNRDPLVEADAHFTEEKNRALLISTADCVPVLLADAATGKIAAIHAGWRGVASKIVPKTLQHFSSSNVFAWIGPHIQKKSFEVDPDVAFQLLGSTPAGKSFVDLDLIVQNQLAESGVKKLETMGIDTKTDLRFHSHRRDREKAGRQLSFILRK